MTNYEKNKDYHKKYNKKYYQEHKEKFKEYNKKNRLKDELILQELREMREFLGLKFKTDEELKEMYKERFI